MVVTVNSVLSTPTIAHFGIGFRTLSIRSFRSSMYFGGRGGGINAKYPSEYGVIPLDFFF